MDYTHKQRTSVYHTDAVGRWGKKKVYKIRSGTDIFENWTESPFYLESSPKSEFGFLEKIINWFMYPKMRHWKCKLLNCLNFVIFICCDKTLDKIIMVVFISFIILYSLVPYLSPHGTSLHMFSGWKTLWTCIVNV